MTSKIERTDKTGFVLLEYNSAKKTMMFYISEVVIWELPGERNNTRNNARCTQARKATHGLDGQHQDVDMTLCGRVSQNDRGQGQMEKVRLWCGQPSDRGRLKNRTEFETNNANIVINLQSWLYENINNSWQRELKEYNINGSVSRKNFYECNTEH